MKLKNKLLIIIFLLIICMQNIVQAEEIKLNATSAILVELSKGKVIYERKKKKKRYPASVTKIMTAILVLENCKLEDMVLVTETALSNIPEGYVTCDIKPGEEISVKDFNAL